MHKDIDVSMELLVPKPEEKIIEHFKQPIKQGQSLKVDEAMALQYADVCADLKELEKVKKHLSGLLMGQRCGKEKDTMLGKALISYSDVEDQTEVDYEAMYKAVNGDPSEADKAKYKRVVRKGYSYCVVKPVEAKA